MHNYLLFCGIKLWYLFMWWWLQFFCHFSVIFCEAVAIYGVIVAIILQTKLESVPQSQIYEPESLRAGYAIFASGIIVGFANLVCGFKSPLFYSYILDWNSPNQNSELFSFLALTILLILLLTTGCVLESLEAAVLYLMLKTPLFLWRFLWSKSLVVHLGCSEWLWELSCQLKPHGRQKRNLLFSQEHYEAVITECSVLCIVNGLCILFFQPLLIGIIIVGMEIEIIQS